MHSATHLIADVLPQAIKGIHDNRSSPENLRLIVSLKTAVKSVCLSGGCPTPYTAKGGVAVGRLPYTLHRKGWGCCRAVALHPTPQRVGLLSGNLTALFALEFSKKEKDRLFLSVLILCGCAYGLILCICQSFLD